MNLDKIQSIMASEIECGVFEQHVLPALEVARKVAKHSPYDGDEGAIAWMVKGNFIEFFTDLEEAHRYAATIQAKVVPLYAASTDEA